MTAQAAQIIGWIREARGKGLFLGVEHPGLYPFGGASGKDIAEWYGNVFGFKVDEGNSSFFVAGPGAGRIEVMKEGDTDRCHLAVLVSDFEAAVAAVKAKGIELEEPRWSTSRTPRPSTSSSATRPATSCTFSGGSRSGAADVRRFRHFGRLDLAPSGGNHARRLHGQDAVGGPDDRQRCTTRRSTSRCCATSSAAMAWARACSTTACAPGRIRLGPGNILGFTTGPLTGSPAPTGTRWTVVCRSPLTGRLGRRQRQRLLRRGAQARRLRRRLLHRHLRRNPSTSTWTMATPSCARPLTSGARTATRSRTGSRASLGKDVEAACIGPAGEKLSLISGVMHAKGRTAARSGLGAVMGSKRLKMVAVRGTQAIPVGRRSGRQRRAQEVRAGDHQRRRLVGLLPRHRHAGLHAGGHQERRLADQELGRQHAGLPGQERLHVR